MGRSTVNLLPIARFVNIMSCDKDTRNYTLYQDTYEYTLYAIINCIQCLCYISLSEWGIYGLVTIFSEQSSKKISMHIDGPLYLAREDSVSKNPLPLLCRSVYNIHINEF